MNKKKLTVGAVLLSGLIATAAYASFVNPRTPVEFFNGHTHADDGTAIGAPSHSGGTDAFGCHNKSVPYHCH
jgi:opacity protein-like surface antigen